MVDFSKAPMAHKDRQHAIMGGGMSQGAFRIQAFYAPAQGTEFHEQMALGAGAARVGCLLPPNTLFCLIEIKTIIAGFVFSERAKVTRFLSCGLVGGARLRACPPASSL